MQYFCEIESYESYAGSENDFHFIYNSNSGGGQAFLGGKFRDDTGNLVSPDTLNGLTAVFAFIHKSSADAFTNIILNDDKAKYDIKPRGEGSTSMKLGIGDRIAPSKIISSFLMLPTTCGVKTPQNLNRSILTSDNYWLQSMWLKCSRNIDNPNVVYLIPIDFVFGGGTNKDTVGQRGRFFKLDANRRISDIIRLSRDEEFLPSWVCDPLKLFASIYTGQHQFQHVECENAIKELMSQLAATYPCQYSGITDPLPFIAEIAIEQKRLRFSTGISSVFSRNRILFGAPGTGKSFTLNKERKALLGESNESDYERVTFHPDYSYANFVGTYKPVPQGEAITYKYVPGPFMRVYVKALMNGRTDSPRPFLLIVEEINRANVAAVFGDIFQLLDRGDDEVSEYPIQASEDIKKYLADELGGVPADYSSIRIPDNMFIWSTMNSADQGVFPMDTAFKRRWDFTYLGIDASEAGIKGKTVILGKNENARIVEWNELRKAINEKLSLLKVNEDKLLGPYFLSRKIVPVDGEIDKEKFIEAFKSKVIMYLFEDAAKQRRPSLFAEKLDTTKYSTVCADFDEKGVLTFCTDISNKFTHMVPDVPADTASETVSEGGGSAEAVDSAEGETE